MGFNVPYEIPDSGTLPQNGLLTRSCGAHGGTRSRYTRVTRTQVSFNHKTKTIRRNAWRNGLFIALKQW